MERPEAKPRTNDLDAGGAGCYVDYMSPSSILLFTSSNPSAAPENDVYACQADATIASATASSVSQLVPRGPALAGPDQDAGIDERSEMVTNGCAMEPDDRSDIGRCNRFWACHD